ncbi:MAG: carbohydrate ABC transporter permease [[Clostridium] scindens]
MIAYILFIAFAIIIILPLVWMIITGFKTNQELFLSPFALPKQWHWENYTDAWSMGIGVYLSNSVIITVAATALSTFVVRLAAYPLARLQFKSKKLWIYLILGGLMLAPSLRSSPFKMVRIAGLYDTRTSLILINAAFRIPFATFLIMTFYKSISIAWTSRHISMGPVPGRYSVKIIVPLSKPIIASCAIVVSGPCGMVMFANIMLQSTDKKTVPVGLMNFQGMTTTNWTLVVASMVIASLPLVIAFLLLQKQFVRGLQQEA